MGSTAMPALSTRSERAVIPDALALRHIPNGGDARPERENGTQTERARCGSLHRAIERKADARIIAAQLRIVQETIAALQMQLRQGNALRGKRRRQRIKTGGSARV